MTRNRQWQRALVSPLILSLLTCTDGPDTTGPAHPLATSGSLTAPGGTAGSLVQFSASSATDSSVIMWDSFSRVVPEGWGEAQAGGAWYTQVTGPTFRVDGARGVITVANRTGLNVVGIGPVHGSTAMAGYGLDVGGLLTYQLDRVPDGLSSRHNIWVYARRNDRLSDGDNTYLFRVRPSRNSIELRIYKTVSDNTAAITDHVTIPGTFDPAARWWIRFEVFGQSPATTLRLRVWKDGTPEPTTWQLSVVVNEPALDVSGTTGVRFAAASDQVTFPMTLYIDDLQYTRLGPPNQAPTANPGGPYSGMAGSAIQMDGRASTDPDGNLPLTYAWKFGDGSTATGATPTHVYGAAGTYTVTLTVTDVNGRSSAPATTSATIGAGPNQAPLANPGGPYYANPGTAVQLDGRASSDPDGNLPLTYAWSFGDGTTGTGATPAHVYATTGTYSVTLTVTDAKGLRSAPASSTVTVSAILKGDTFSRFVSQGWGDAEIGGGWYVQPTAAYFNVDGARGVITATDNVVRNVVGRGPVHGATSTPDYGLNVTGIASYRIDRAPDGSSSKHVVQVYARRNDRLSDGDFYYRFRVRVSRTAIEMRIEKSVNGSTSGVTDVTSIPATFDPAAKWWIRWEAFGTSPATTVRMRVWKDGSPEPTTWHRSAVVNDSRLDQSGTTGVRFQVPSDQVTYPVRLYVDDLQYNRKT
jgi:large repetitive protein